jgi:Peptidase MA superfamily
MGASCKPTIRLLCLWLPLSLRERVVAGVKVAVLPAPTQWRRRVPRLITLQPWLLGLCLVCCLCTLPVLSSAETWQEKTSTHFRVFYQQDTAFAAAVLTYAEAYYNQIRLDLGLTHVVQRDQVPWLWEQRCQIYLYPNRQAYAQATGAPAWSGGFVQYRRRTVYSFLGAPVFLEEILPHELAHIVFREFVGFDNDRIPRWLDEGVAQYAEVGRREAAWGLMQAWLAQGTYIPLVQLNQLRLGHASGGAARLFYTQSVTLVHFFLAAYGPRRFIDFCSNLRDGYSVERALSFATSSSIASLSALEDAWRALLLSDS